MDTLKILRSADPCVMEAVRSGQISMERAVEIAQGSAKECHAMAVQDAVCSRDRPRDAVSQFEDMVRVLGRTETEALKQHVCESWGLIEDKSSPAAVRRDMDRFPGHKRPKESDFAAFWSVYPKKVAKNAAVRAFEKAFLCLRRRMGSQEVVALLVEKARIYASKRDPQYYCNPATWLNDGRWEDDLSSIMSCGTNESLGARETFRDTEQFSEWLQPQKQ